MSTASQSGSPTLVLFPTELERRRFSDRGGLPLGLALQGLCGFGPVTAAARSGQLVTSLRPARVVLCGIAGTFDSDRHPVGTAQLFGRVALDGVGVGQGEAHLAPPALGFPQWPGSDDTRTAPIEMQLPLARPASAGSAGDDEGPLLLTTCAASASADEVRLRRKRFPEAVAEDMEGFAVAMSCALARVPLFVVRGFSNLVGDRDSKNWRIAAALAAARERTIELLESAR